MLTITCHSGLDPESCWTTLYSGMLNQVQHDWLNSLHAIAAIRNVNKTVQKELTDMQYFEFCCPTDIVFGRKAEEKLAAKVVAHGGKRVFIVYGGGSVVQSGLLARLQNSLAQADIAFTAFGGAKPNPTLAHAREGVIAAAKFGADMILAVGGGSTIDTAKAIAHGAANLNIDIWEFWSGQKPVTQSLPVGVVLTIPAAGSELSNSAVLTNEETGKKCGINTQFNRPAFALLNPELAMTLPKKQLVCGIADIMMHTIDRYFTVEEGNEFTDCIAEALLKTVIKYAPVLAADRKNYAAMSEIMWCGSVSHNGLTSLGRTMDFGVHKLGHELSGRFDVTHGASLTAMWGSWARTAYPLAPERFARYAQMVWNVTTGTAEEKARAGIRHTEEFWHRLGLPINFTELGIGIQSEETLAELAAMCTTNDTKPVGVFLKLDQATALNIYRQANH